MSRRAKAAAPGTLGDVAPGDWATLEDGREVMARWHSSGLTAVELADGTTNWGTSNVAVTSVRKRDRTPVQGGGETDPLRRDS